MKNFNLQRVYRRALGSCKGRREEMEVGGWRFDGGGNERVDHLVNRVWGPQEKENNSFWQYGRRIWD